MKIKKIFFLFFFSLLLSSTSIINAQDLNINELKNYEKEYSDDDYGVCSTSSTKTYMDYRAITDTSSTQYQYIQDHMHVDKVTGLLLDEDNFIGVALGSYYGEIGDRFYFELENGAILPLVKIEEKAQSDTYEGCYHISDGSVIEFVIDRQVAQNHFGTSENGYVLSGNFNNYEIFKGDIVSVTKVSDEKIDINERQSEVVLKNKVMKLNENGGGIKIIAEISKVDNLK